MEPVNPIWLVGIAALVIGAVIGAIAYRLFTPAVKNAGKLQAQLNEVKEELDTYKASVSSHFNKTSDLVNELTQDYVKVYKHLAEGAQALGDPKEFTNVLEQHQGKVLISFGDESDVQGTVVNETPVNVSELKETPEESVEVASEQAVEPATQENISETIKEVAEKMKGAESAEPATGQVTDEEAAAKVAVGSATEPRKLAEGGSDIGQKDVAVSTGEQKVETPSPEPTVETAKTRKTKQPTEEAKQESDFPL